MIIYVWGSGAGWFEVSGPWLLALLGGALVVMHFKRTAGRLEYVVIEERSVERQKETLRYSPLVLA